MEEDGDVDVGDTLLAVLVVLDVDVTGYVFPGSTRQTRTVRNPSTAMVMRLIVFDVSPLWSKICLPCTLSTPFQRY